MDKHQAFKMLKEALEEVPSLLKLRYNDPRRDLWYYKVVDILKAGFGPDSDELDRFEESAPRKTVKGRPDQLQSWSNNRLVRRATALASIIDKPELLHIPLSLRAAPKVEATAEAKAEPPKAFIAHGGKSPALTKLCDFLSALGVKPLVVEDEPSEGRSIGEQVKWCLDRCDCAIVLATKGDIDGNTGEFIPRGNVLNEIGRFQEKFSSRIVYLIESGTKFPSNISEKVRARFTPQSMDRAFIKVAKELAAFGIIKAVKPE